MKNFLYMSLNEQWQRISSIRSHRKTIRKEFYAKASATRVSKPKNPLESLTPEQAAELLEMLQ